MIQQWRILFENWNHSNEVGNRSKSWKVCFPKVVDTIQIILAELIREIIIVARIMDERIVNNYL